MSNVLNEEQKQQVIALGRLGWSLRRIERETSVRRETVSAYLKEAGIALRLPRGRRIRAKPASRAGEVTPDSALAKPASEAVEVTPRLRRRIGRGKRWETRTETRTQPLGQRLRTLWGNH